MIDSEEYSHNLGSQVAALLRQTTLFLYIFLFKFLC